MQEVLSSSTAIASSPSQPSGSAIFDRDQGFPTSASGLLALLNDEHLQLQIHALYGLNQIVDYLWAEMADYSNVLESMANNPNFPERNLAFLLLSKIHFYLNSHDKAVEYALKSGNSFNIDENSLYVETILAKALDQYVQGQEFIYNNKNTQVDQDPILIQLVESLIQKCLNQKDYPEAIGLSIDAHRLDILDSILKERQVLDKLGFYLKMIQEIALRFKTHKLLYQRELLYLILNVATGQPDLDFQFIIDCHVILHEPQKCAKIFQELLKKSKKMNNIQNVSIDQSLQSSFNSNFNSPSSNVNNASSISDKSYSLALQTAFNLYENSSQAFMNEFLKELTAPQEESKESKQENLIDNLVLSILNGTKNSELHLKFLCQTNNSDLMILERTKDTLNVHNSMHHAAIVYSNAIMQAGTTNDQFLRKNLEWLAYASNWSKFSAASSLGLIHRGQLQTSDKLLDPYLPKPNTLTNSPYSEGGALFALGLIHSKHAAEYQLNYLLGYLNNQSEIIQHGAALGLGAAAIASSRQDIVEALKGVLYGDNAVVGEASSIAIGLIMLGTGNLELTEELLQYAHETQHEKIIRGIGIAISLIWSGLKDQSLGIINRMFDDKDPIIRYGAILTISMSFVGTGDNDGIRKLLHAAVSESNDDVRRAAVIGLSFILYRNPKELPKIIQLLAKSFNPHVRYAVSLALGIAFAATGDEMALEMIRSMCQDLIDFVRQGAYIGMSMILQETLELSSFTTPSNPISNESQQQQQQGIGLVRKTLETSATSKHEDAAAKFGAILGQGIIDVSGRNGIFSLIGTTGQINLVSAAGMMLFCQFWYWYPLINYVTFAIKPTGLIAVDGRCNTPPEFHVTCESKPSLFAYPPPLKPLTLATPKKMTSAILSATSKMAAKKKAIESMVGEANENNGKEMINDEMEEGGKNIKAMLVDEDSNKMEIEKSFETKEKENEVEKGKQMEKGKDGNASIEESNSFCLKNLSRIQPHHQKKLLTISTDQRYYPINPSLIGNGIVVLYDNNPELPPYEPFPLSTSLSGNGGAITSTPNSDASLNSQGVKMETVKEPSPPAPFKI